MKEFKRRIQTLSPLDQDELELLEDIMCEKHYKKGDYLLNIDQTNRKLYFINTGLLKVSFYKESKEFIMKFFFDNEFCAVLDSLQDELPSKYAIIAIRDTHVIEINYDKLKELASRSQSFTKIISGISKMATKTMMKRIRELLETEGRQRYLNFIENDGHLIEHISLRDLSGYLGLSQVSLSRIRASI